MRVSNVKIEPEIVAKFEQVSKLLGEISRGLLGESLGVEHGEYSLPTEGDSEHDEDRLEIATLVISYSRLILRLARGVLPSKEEVDANTALTKLLTPIMFQAATKAHTETEKAKMDFRKARIDELESLVRLRHTMAEVGDDVAEIDIRISAMKNVLFGPEADKAA